jgi:hypothetical protein
MNKNFARVEGGHVVFDAPDSLKLRRTVEPEEEGGEPVERLFSFQNPTAEQYAEAGFLPVVAAPMPEAPEGYHYEDDYVPGDGAIRQTWELVEDPDPDEQEISAEEALEIITGGGAT